MNEPGEIAGEHLLTIVERIEKLEEEIKQLTEDKKDIYLEAKGAGYDVKILKEVIRLGKQDRDEREEQESLLDAYLMAIEHAGAGPPVKKAA